MSLSRPIRFPLLKLPWLCIKCVLHNSHLFDIIYFATISKRTRKIVRHSNYPLEKLDVSPRVRQMKIGYVMGKMKNGKTWQFMHDKYAYDDKFVLQRGSQPFRNSRNFYSYEGHYLTSYTTGDTLDALKMGIDFMIDAFGCGISTLYVDGNKISEIVGLGISTVEILNIGEPGPDNLTDLKYLLETIKVTKEYVFYVRIPEDFYCDPQIFKCRELFFGCKNSADWVTLEILCQFDVPQLFFSYHRFSVEDVVSYINYWFTSENRKLDEKRRNRYPLNESWKNTDLSRGKDILRKDGLLATLHAYPSSIFFYVWHKRFPDTV